MNWPRIKKNSILRYFLLMFVIMAGLVSILGSFGDSGDDDGEADPPVPLYVQIWGNGTVVSDPAGIDCGLDCDEEYDRFTWVGLTATPADGWQFDGWGLDATGSSATVDVRMEGTRDVQAYFSQPGQTHTLTVSTEGGGSVISEPPGIDCGSDCSEDFDSPGGSLNIDDYTLVELKLDGNPGLVFAGWSGDIDCMDSWVLMNGDKKCIVSFVQSQDMRTLNVFLLGNGSVSSSEPGVIDCGLDCSHTIEEGETIVLTATPDYGSYFAGWGGDCDGTDASISITRDNFSYYWSDCIAIFKDEDVPPIASFTVTKPPLVADPTATFDASACTDDQTIVSYEWDFNYDGSVFNPTAEGMVANHTYAAVGTYTVRLRVTDNQGYSSFAEQTIEIEEVVIPDPGTLHALDISTSGNGSVVISLDGVDCGEACPDEIEEGVTVSMTPVPESGWQFDRWTGDCSGSSPDIEVVMDSDIQCTAVFTILPSSDTDPPVWSGQVLITANSDPGMVYVEWGTATDAQSPPVTYLVYLNSVNPPWNGTVVEKSAAEHWHMFTGLTAGYWWVGVRARDNASTPNIDQNVDVWGLLVN